MGMLYKRGNVWWVKYYRDGRPMRESVGKGATEKDARRILRLREADVERGVPVSPKVGRIRFGEAMVDVLNDYKTNGKKSHELVGQRITKHLAPRFNGRRLSTITTAELRQYVADSLEAGAKPATVNREMAILRRGFTLAMQAGKLYARPHVPMLKEDNVRSGFFDADQYAAVMRHLPSDVQPMIAFAYLTGWRIRSEVQCLQWRQVDLGASGSVRLDPGTTKNGEGRQFPMTSGLRAVLETQRAYTDGVQRERGMVVPWVFHRNGQPIRDFRDAWQKACLVAGCPGRIVHDLRRTAVRNLVRAGIPERVAMTMTGHRTRAVFERYNIVSEGDLLEAVYRLDRSLSR